MTATEYQTGEYQVRQLAQASQAVADAARAIQLEMTGILEAIEHGYHTSAPSNQRPFDLARAVEARRLAIEACQRAGVSDEFLERAARGDRTLA